MSDAHVYDQYPGMESVSYYRRGGYHPVSIDDIFQDRYRVVNKLGYGAFATVWLVEDLLLKRFSSLKILAADASTDTADTGRTRVSSEIDVIRYLKVEQQQIPIKAGSEYVMKIFDDFEIVGPNGTHRCIVTEIMGPNLASDIEDIYDDEVFPVDIGKKMAAQIARGVAYLHSCGIVHGDLHLGNMLLFRPEIEHWSLQELQQHFGEPETRPVLRRDRAPFTWTPHLPKYLVSLPDPMPLLQLCITTASDVHVKICDFGEAFLYNTIGAPLLNSITLNTPRVYAAPEILFPQSSPLGPLTDIWALAVLMHMILTGGALLFSSSAGIDKEIVREMVLTLGKLPERMWTQWADRKDYFDDDAVFIGDINSLRWVSTGDRSPLPRKLIHVSAQCMGKEELNAFQALIRKMVRYETSDRISADEVVQLIPPTWMGDVV